MTPLEEHLPWRPDILRARAECYRRAGDPRAARAAADLDEFLAAQPSRSGLAPGPTLQAPPDAAVTYARVGGSHGGTGDRAPVGVHGGGTSRRGSRARTRSDGARADRGARRPRSAHAGRPAQGGAPPVRAAGAGPPRLRRPPASDRRGPDDLAALHRGRHDRGHRPARRREGARDRDRVGLPGGGPRGDGGHRLHDRDRAQPGRRGARDGWRGSGTAPSTRARATDGRDGPSRRRSTRSWSPPPPPASPRRSSSSSETEAGSSSPSATISRSSGS